MICALGGKPVASSHAYCFTDEERGLRDALVCPACLVAYVEEHYGILAPNAVQIRSFYGEAVPSCDGLEVGV